MQKEGDESLKPGSCENTPPLSSSPDLFYGLLECIEDTGYHPIALPLGCFQCNDSDTDSDTPSKERSLGRRMAKMGQDKFDLHQDKTSTFMNWNLKPIAQTPKYTSNLSCINNEGGQGRKQEIQVLNSKEIDDNGNLELTTMEDKISVLDQYTKDISRNMSGSMERFRAVVSASDVSSEEGNIHNSETDQHSKYSVIEHVEVLNFENKDTNSRKGFEEITSPVVSNQDKEIGYESSVSPDCGKAKICEERPCGSLVFEAPSCNFPLVGNRLSVKQKQKENPLARIANILSKNMSPMSKDKVRQNVERLNKNISSVIHKGKNSPGDKLCHDTYSGNGIEKCGSDVLLSGIMEPMNDTVAESAGKEKMSSPQPIVLDESQSTATDIVDNDVRSKLSVKTCVPVLWQDATENVNGQQNVQIRKPHGKNRHDARLLQESAEFLGADFNATIRRSDRKRAVPKKLESYFNESGNVPFEYPSAAHKKQKLRKKISLEDETDSFSILEKKGDVTSNTMELHDEMHLLMVECENTNNCNSNSKTVSPDCSPKKESVVTVNDTTEDRIDKNFLLKSVRCTRNMLKNLSTNLIMKPIKKACVSEEEHSVVKVTETNCDQTFVLADPVEEENDGDENAMDENLSLTNEQKSASEKTTSKKGRKKRGKKSKRTKNSLNCDSKVTNEVSVQIVPDCAPVYISQEDSIKAVQSVITAENCDVRYKCELQSGAGRKRNKKTESSADSVSNDPSQRKRGRKKGSQMRSLPTAANCDTSTVNQDGRSAESEESTLMDERPMCDKEINPVDKFKNNKKKMKIAVTPSKTSISDSSSGKHKVSNRRTNKIPREKQKRKNVGNQNATEESKEELSASQNKWKANMPQESKSLSKVTAVTNKPKKAKDLKVKKQASVFSNDEAKPNSKEDMKMILAKVAWNTKQKILKGSAKFRVVTDPERQAEIMSSRPVECHYCKAMISHCKLKEHVKEQHKFKCFQCSLFFKSKKKKAKHMAKKHKKAGKIVKKNAKAEKISKNLENELYHCILCEQTVTTIKAFQRHLKSNVHKLSRHIQGKCLCMVENLQQCLQNPQEKSSVSSLENFVLQGNRRNVWFEENDSVLEIEELQQRFTKRTEQSNDSNTTVTTHYYQDLEMIQFIRKQVLAFQNLYHHPMSGMLQESTEYSYVTNFSMMNYSKTHSVSGNTNYFLPNVASGNPGNVQYGPASYQMSYIPSGSADGSTNPIMAGQVGCNANSVFQGQTGVNTNCIPDEVTGCTNGIFPGQIGGSTNSVFQGQEGHNSNYISVDKVTGSNNGIFQGQIGGSTNYISLDQFSGRTNDVFQGKSDAFQGGNTNCISASHSMPSASSTAAGCTIQNNQPYGLFQNNTVSSQVVDPSQMAQMTTNIHTSPQSKILLDQQTMNASSLLSGTVGSGDQQAEVDSTWEHGQLGWLGRAIQAIESDPTYEIPDFLDSQSDVDNDSGFNDSLTSHDSSRSGFTNASLLSNEDLGTWNDIEHNNWGLDYCQKQAVVGQYDLPSTMANTHQAGIHQYNVAGEVDRTSTGYNHTNFPQGCSFSEVNITNIPQSLQDSAVKEVDTIHAGLHSHMIKDSCVQNFPQSHTGRDTYPTVLPPAHVCVETDTHSSDFSQGHMCPTRFPHGHMVRETESFPIDLSQGHMGKETGAGAPSFPQEHVVTREETEIYPTGFPLTRGSMVKEAETCAGPGFPQIVKDPKSDILGTTFPQSGGVGGGVSQDDIMLEYAKILCDIRNDVLRSRDYYD